MKKILPEGGVFFIGSGETKQGCDLWIACTATYPHKQSLAHPLLHSAVGASLYLPRTLSSSLSFRILDPVDEGLDSQDGLLDVRCEAKLVEAFRRPNVD
jgi:hypothetical protein